MITVIVITFSHPQYINYFLENQIKTYFGDLFSFEIHDSSCDDSTKELVQLFNSQNDKKVKYFRYDSSILPDVKANIAMNNCQSEYLYLMGDGIGTDFNYLEQLLFDGDYTKYDFVGILPNSFKYSKIIKRKYPNDDFFYKNNDLNSFTSDFLYAFTLYGGSVVSKRMMECIKHNHFFDIYKHNDNYAYAYICSVFHSLLFNSNFKYCFCFLSGFKTNPYKKRSTWTYGEVFFKIFFEEFYNDISKLPYENRVKNKILIQQRKIGFNSICIIRYRMFGVLNFKYVGKYKKYFKAQKCNMLLVYFVCLIPPRLLSFLSNIKSRFRKAKRSE